ncbi:MAG: hypothetical protein L0H83_16095, partial [Salinisphaera sp.]|nr:hypothetical protein [Salinisphaera sp.]
MFTSNMLMSHGTPPGQFATSSAQQWVVPANITSICAVAIGNGGPGTEDGAGGGGGLSYTNNIAVTPFETLSIDFNTGLARLLRGVATLLAAENGSPAGATVGPGGQATNGVGDVKNSGGDGGDREQGSLGGG